MATLPPELTTNNQLVVLDSAGQVVIEQPLRAMSRSQAFNLAAWLVSIAEQIPPDAANKRFEDFRAAIR